MAVRHPRDVGKTLASTNEWGIARFDSTDFSVTDGYVNLSATGNIEDVSTDSGAVTPAAGTVGIIGGEGIDTSGSGANVTVAVESATTSNIGGVELATDAEAQAQTDTARALTPSNLAAEGYMQWEDVTLTAAQIKALAATQITLVAAQGAGSFIQFLGATLKLNYGSEVFTESADNLVIKYTDASGVAVSDVIECTGFIDQSADTLTVAIPIKDPIVAASAGENAPLVIDNNGDGEFGGNASNDSTITIRIYYVVHSI